MQVIKKSTKKGSEYLIKYENSFLYELSDCYGRCSYNNIAAYNECREICEKENGEGFRILSFSRFVFSVGWMTEKGLRVETATNSLLIC